MLANGRLGCGSRELGFHNPTCRPMLLWANNVVETRIPKMVRKYFLILLGDVGARFLIVLLKADGTILISRLIIDLDFTELFLIFADIVL